MTGYSIPYLQSVVAEHGDQAAICPWCDHTWDHGMRHAPVSCPECGNTDGLVFEIPYHIEHAQETA